MNGNSALSTVASVDEAVPTAPAKARIFFPNLDGLRLFAFFSIFLFHFFCTASPAVLQSPTPHLERFLPGYLVVERLVLGLFFAFILLEQNHARYPVLYCQGCFLST